MSASRPLSTEEMLGLLGAALVVLLLIPARNVDAYAVLAVVLTGSLLTLGVAAAVLAYRDQSLDVVDGALVVAVGTLLLVPSAVVLTLVSAVSTTGLATLSVAFVWSAIPEASRLVVQWAVPAILLFPLGLARDRRSRVAVGVALVAALVVAVALTPTHDFRAVAGALLRFAAAVLLGGPLFVAAREFPHQLTRALAGAR